jgi:hypothetical protein
MTFGAEVFNVLRCTIDFDGMLLTILVGNTTDLRTICEETEQE